MDCEFDEKVRCGYRKLTEALISGGLTVTTMESCTSGQVASLITDTEGASAVLKGAYITYSNMAKIMCGVPAETIEKFGVYSAETAGDMAAASKKAYSTDFSIGVTGSMGNADPANADSVPGQVWFAIGCPDGEIKVFYREIAPQPSRLEYKMKVAWEILGELEGLIEIYTGGKGR